MPSNPLLTQRPSATGKSSDNPERIFYAVFCDAEELPFWCRLFVREGFGHCYVMCQSGPVCVAVEQVNYAILQHCYWNMLEPGQPMNADLIARVWADMGVCVVRFSTRFSKGTRAWGACNALPTCVNLCKKLLGISCRAQTPFGLYRWLLANDGELVKGEIDHGWPKSAG